MKYLQYWLNLAAYFELGERRRKSILGCIVSQEMSVLNLVILQNGKNDPPGLNDMEHGYCGSGNVHRMCKRGDHSRFITHGGKDFLSSIKDIENRFFRASECGKEVSRMLETNKVVSKFSDGEGTSGAPICLVDFHLACCHRGLDLTSQEPPKQVTKAITWYRSPSSQSSSLRNRLTSASRNDGYESGSDFNEEFSMITGSHSSILDRLNAWEMKLYAEVKRKPLKVLLRIQETLYPL